MSQEGIDSLSPAPVAAMVAAQKSFACRYLKNLTAGEVSELKAHGRSIVAIFESTGTDFTLGFAQGAADAREGNAQAIASGIAGCPIYFAIDTQTALYSEIRQYLAGAASVIGFNRTGVYGDYNVVTQMIEAKACRYFWQTYAWSSGLVQGQAHILQYLNGQTLGGVEVDLDRTLYSDIDYGQFDPPSPDPPPAPEEYEMPHRAYRYIVTPPAGEAQTAQYVIDFDLLCKFWIEDGADLAGILLAYPDPAGSPAGGMVMDSKMAAIFPTLGPEAPGYPTSAHYTQEH